jgi:hypothetical protein
MFARPFDAQDQKNSKSFGDKTSMSVEMRIQGPVRRYSSNPLAV